MKAATLAGMSFGNAGVHVPHAMSYAVAGMIRDYHPEGWPKGPSLCLHGISVVVNAPAAFRFTASANPSRHLRAASALGADCAGAEPELAGEILAASLIALMREAGIPNGLQALNYGSEDVPQLAAGAFQQQRLLSISPREVSQTDLEAIYADAMRYW